MTLRARLMVPRVELLYLASAVLAAALGGSGCGQQPCLQPPAPRPVRTPATNPADFIVDCTVGVSNRAAYSIYPITWLMGGEMTVYGEVSNGTGAEIMFSCVDVTRPLKISWQDGNDGPGAPRKEICLDLAPLRPHRAKIKTISLLYHGDGKWELHAYADWGAQHPIDLQPQPNPKTGTSAP